MTGYDYNVTQVLKAQKSISVADLNAVPDTLTTVQDDFQQNFLPEFAAKLHSTYGISVLESNLAQLVVTVEETTPEKLYFKINLAFTIKTDKPCHQFGSPIAWWIKDLVVLAAKVFIICVGIYIVQWAITNILEALKSLTTLTNISQIHDDNEVNPSTGEPNPNYCSWHEIRTEEPNIFGSMTLIIIMIVIGLVVLFGVGGLRKKS